MADPQYARDVEGNLYEIFPRSYLYGDTLGNLDTARGAAAACLVTLAADSTARWVVDFARVCIASIAANTTVLATLDTGVDTYTYAFSTNGVHDLLEGALSKIGVLADSNTAVTLATDTGGTASTVTVHLGGHKLHTADV